MAVFNKKDRMVSFRLSGAEYAAAESNCTQLGIRSVSTLARDAMMGLLSSPRRAAQAADAEILLQLQHQVLVLRDELDRLAGAIGSRETAAAARPVTHSPSFLKDNRTS